MSEEILELESRKCFDFFWNEANRDKNSLGYGLIRDRAPGNPSVASIASVGFGLTAIIIGTERGWITREEGYARASGTLRTVLNNVSQINGFFFHFIDMNSGKRAWNSEVSIIDTAILLCGTITAGEYFKQEVGDLAQRLYENVNWEWYRDPQKNLFHMGYSPKAGFSGWWDFYAEQLVLYILGAGAPAHNTKGDLFYSFARHTASYKQSNKFIHSWFGSLFTHQYSHAWIDFRNKTDNNGTDWWENSVEATKANRQFCLDDSKEFKTFNPYSWGLTACDGPKGYNGRYGASPSGRCNNEHYTDGTVPPSGAAGSIVFIPDAVIEALDFYYCQYPGLWGKYGFKDGYNLDVSPAWYAPDVIGINKGITLLMIENYRTGLVWRYFMDNKFVRRGLQAVGIIDRKLQTASA